MSDSNHPSRRTVLKLTTASAAAFGSTGLASATASSEDYHVREANGREIARVLRSEQFRTIARDLADNGDRLAVRRAKVVEKERRSDAFKLAVPLKSDTSFDPVETVTGLHARVVPEDDELHVIVNYEDDSLTAAEVGSRTQPTQRYSATTAGDDEVSILSGCQYSDITPGYKCMGVYDTEEACTVIGAAAVLIPSNDVTGIGVIDDVLLPAVGAGAAGCALEQAIEMGITDWLNACSTNNWVWELYQARWWNPVPQQFLAIPRCG